MGAKAVGTNDTLEVTLTDSNKTLAGDDGVETCRVDGFGIFYIVHETMNDELKIHWQES